MHQKGFIIHVTQVKAKRLFLWFSDRHGHDWRQVLETNDIDLGRGKRMLIKGGAYNATYQITLPREMADGSEQSLKGESITKGAKR